MRATPFQTTLYLTNLPPTTRPSHLTHIIAHPPARHGKRGKRRETGITMVQVYTVPTHPTPHHTTHSALSHLSAFLRAALCISPLDTDESLATSPRGSFEKPDEQQTVVEREVPEEETTGHDHESNADEGREETMVRKGATGGDEKTVAYIHFCCETHMRWAKRILRSVTIDGKPVVARTKRFNSGLVKRLWTATSSAGKAEKCE
ncbi:hypothetical protein IAT38_007028 [Cryptococcus sp. DSM 104549]